MNPCSAVDNAANQPQQNRICHDTAQASQHDFMIDRREELDDIGFQIPREPPQELLSPSDGSMRAFSFATRIAVKNEASFKDRFQHIHNRMMHNAIWKWSGTDQPRLGLGHMEMMILAGLPRL